MRILDERDREILDEEDLLLLSSIGLYSSKNLLKISIDTQTINGVTFTVNYITGEIILSGTAEYDIDRLITYATNYKDTDKCYLPKIDQNYIISGCPSGGSDDSYYLYLSHATLTVGKDYGDSITFHNQYYIAIDIGIHISAGTVCDGLVFKPMVRLEGTSSDFEVYKQNLYNKILVNSSKIDSLSKEHNNDISINKTSIGCQIKNLLNNTAVSKEVNGITYTINDDKSVTISGTATSTSVLVLGDFDLPPGEYVLNGCTDGSSTTYRLDLMDINGVSFVYNYLGNTSFTLDSNTNIRPRIVIYPDAGEVNKTIYPMICYKDISNKDYEAYKPSLDKRVTKNESNILSLMTGVCLYNKSSYCTFMDDGYVMRIGNQVHINCKLLVNKAVSAWVGSVISFPFAIKSPNSDGSRYTITNTQSDGRQTSVYINNGANSLFTSTEFQVGDIIEINGLILDMYIEEVSESNVGE